MKNKILLILSVFVGGLLLHSCSDDVLEQVNPNKITTDSFWQTTAQCEQGVNAIYNAFKNRDLMAMKAESQRSDLAHKDQNDSNNPFYLKNYNNSHADIQRKWAALYTGIFRANQAIEGLAKFKELNPDVDEVQYNNWIGQARFFRGLFHFYLHASFNNGEIPIRDIVPAVVDDYYVTVSPADEVFDFFMTDLKASYAEGMLPDSWVTGQEGKITRGAAAAIIGQAYLFEEKYDSARFYFEDVLNNANYGYQLTEEAEDNVTTRNELNTESILEIVYSYSLKPEEQVNSQEGLSAKYVDDVSPVESQYGGSLYPSYWLQMAYKNDSLDSTDPRNLVKVFDIITGEPLLGLDGTDSVAVRQFNRRASAYIAFVDDEASTYYLSRPVFAYSFGNKQSAAFKMLSNCNEFPYLDSERDNSETYKSGVNYRVLRLADVYLMYAEALIDGGDSEGGVNVALSYINKIRNRSALLLCGMPTGEFASSDFDDKTYSATDVMNQLMNVERPLELSVQGHATRHLDLRRWGVYKERFQELADIRYSFGSYPHENWKPYADDPTKRQYTYPVGDQTPKQRIVDPTTQKEVIRWGSILYYDTYFEDAVGWNGTPPSADSYRNEYAESAANYIDDIHGYWPIPLVEETTNPFIYGK